MLERSKEFGEGWLVFLLKDEGAGEESMANTVLGGAEFPFGGDGALGFGAIGAGGLGTAFGAHFDFRIGWGLAGRTSGNLQVIEGKGKIGAKFS